MNRLTLFGLLAVTAMLVTYALENRSRWFILAFSVACVMGSSLRLPARSLALRNHRGYLVAGGSAALVADDASILNDPQPTT